ncbi:MAG: DNA repair exonuclease [Pirellulales bacterium]
MTSISKFIHAADVHLDSPLDGLRRLDQATANRLQQASRRSLEVMVQTALEKSVDAVLIAGDLFDGPVKDAGAGLWVDSQFKRLSRAGIPVVLIRGNHDAQSNARRVVHWSEGVHMLGTDAAETRIMEHAGLAIHGQSFGARAEMEDMAVAYPKPVAGFFNIGMLHTSLAGSAAHDVYAPTTVSVLESKGYDYWALGHIHQRSVQSLSSQCFVGYSGNTQGRHIRESGPRGFNLVEVQDGRLSKVEFVASDSLRWYEIQLDVSTIDSLGDVEDLLQPAIDPLQQQSEGRTMAVRIRLTGSTSLHRELTTIGTLEKLADTLSMRLNELGDIWLEKVKLYTRPQESALSAELDLPLKYLGQVTEELIHDQAMRSQLSETLEELFKKSRQELLPIDSPLVTDVAQEQELLRLLQSAQDFVLSRLSSEAR